MSVKSVGTTEKYSSWEDIQGYWIKADSKDYGELIEQLPDGGTLVEIGCFRGKSLASVSDILKRKNIKVWVFDIFGTRSYDEPDVESKKVGMLPDFIETMRLYGLDPVVVCVTGKEALARIASVIEPDMVFVDGDHTYEGVKLDFETWYPRLKEGGIFSGHDYGPQWAGVWKNIEEKFGHEGIKHREDMNDGWQGSVWSMKKGAK